MSRLVADSLEVASFDAGKLVLVRGPMLAGSYTELWTLLRAASSAKELALSAHTPNQPLLETLILTESFRY